MESVVSFFSLDQFCDSVSVNQRMEGMHHSREGPWGRQKAVAPESLRQNPSGPWAVVIPFPTSCCINDWGR